jgi:hypothetical protein
MYLKEAPFTSPRALMIKELAILALVVLGIPVGLMWGGWKDWGVRHFIWAVLKFAALLLVTGGLLTLCGDPGRPW